MNVVIKERELKSETALKIVKGDITEEQVDAIVNAANSYLKHGGGVAGAIVRKGGQIIQEESDRIGFVAVGEAAITVGGNLPARFVIHAVGPRWGEGDEDNKLSRAVTNSLMIATEQNLRTISLPAISSGIFGFPKARCADIILKTIQKFVRKNSKSTLQEIRICLFDDSTLKEFLDIF